MWPFSITTPKISLPETENGTSTARLIVILGGASAIIFGAAYFLKNLYPFFDDLHESNSEADSDDSNSDDSNESEESELDAVGERILQELRDKDGDKPNSTLFGF